MSEPKITIKPPKGETPSEQIIKQATNEVTITDILNRVILLRKPNPLSQYRIVEAVGNSAENRVYMAMVLPLIYVASIDGLPVVMINNKQQLEALIQRLDEDGISAVATAVQENFGSSSDQETEKAQLKN